MSKVTVFYLISSKFFVSLFLGTLIFFPHMPNKNPPAYYLFDFLVLTTDFLDFLDLKNFIRLFRPKNFLNRLKTLKNTFVAFRLMRKTIFLILDFIAKNCPSYDTSCNTQ